MKFDVVITNPPYNNDIYLEFVTMGHKLAGKCVCMITPAKWQAKGGAKNEEFRKNIVPYMKEIVFYPDTGDVFNIRLQGGICYYIITNDKQTICNIDTKCKRVKHFNYKENIEICNRKHCLFGDKVGKILDKIGVFGSQFDALAPYKYVKNSDKWSVYSALNASDSSGHSSFAMFSADGSILMTTPSFISNTVIPDYKRVFSAITEDICESYISYIDSKIVRFLILMRYCRNSVNNDESWAFVPDPGKFDHIFTDAELYEKYNLTEEEINIIESVIKERKQF